MGCSSHQRCVEFTSPSAAAAVIHGGSANGLTAWKDKRVASPSKELEDALKPVAFGDPLRHAPTGRSTPSWSLSLRGQPVPASANATNATFRPGLDPRSGVSPIQARRPRRLAGALHCHQRHRRSRVGQRAFLLCRPSSSGLGPPGWVFGPVWSALFLAMAVAAWLIWRVPQASRARSLALGLFVVQLVANALWSWLFFAASGAAWPLPAEVPALWLLIACTLAAFWRIRPAAGWLPAPYLAWVTFASALNYVLWQLNPAVLG